MFNLENWDCFVNNPRGIFQVDNMVEQFASMVINLEDEIK